MNESVGPTICIAYSLNDHIYIIYIYIYIYIYILYIYIYIYNHINHHMKNKNTMGEVGYVWYLLHYL